MCIHTYAYLYIIHIHVQPLTLRSLLDGREGVRTVCAHPQESGGVTAEGEGEVTPSEGIAFCCNVLHCAAVCCSVLQCVAVEMRRAGRQGGR